MSAAWWECLTKTFLGMSHQEFLILAGGATEFQREEKSLNPIHVLWECTRPGEEDELKANRQQKMKPSGCTV